MPKDPEPELRQPHRKYCRINFISNRFIESIKIYANLAIQIKHHDDTVEGNDDQARGA